MPTPPIPADEELRLESLHMIEDLGFGSGERFERVVRLAARLLGTPMAFLSLVGRERVQLMARVGLSVADLPRADAFCPWVVVADEPLVVPDASKDPRFVSSPLVVGETGVRFYAGCPVAGPDGSRLGALAVLDRVPRDVASSDLTTLADLAHCAGDLFCSGPTDQALALFQESEARRRAVLDSIVDGAITINEDGLMEAFNSGAERIFGWRADDAIGRDVGILMPEPERSRHPSCIARYLQTGIAKVVGKTREVTALRKDGSTFPMELSVTHVRGHSGRLFVAVVRDIGERRRSEQELRRQATALEAAANAIVITGRDGVIRWVNPAFTQLTGYTRGEAVGRDTRILKSGKHDAPFYEALWQTVLSGRVWQGEVTNRRKGGDLYTEEMTITPVRDAQGDITEFVAIKQDITERKAVERMKNEFVSTVSHELRTPLTSIRGSLGLIAGGVAGELPPQVRRLVDIALNNSDRLVCLINDILDIEKIESGRMDFRMQPTDLLGIVRQAIEANQAFAAQHSVALELREAPERVEVLGDSDRLIQVMTNLLSNAAKFSPSGGLVAVRITPSGDSVRVSVVDQGPGIPEEFRSRIFRRFAQADSSDTRQKGGTGLGLNIAKAIVERHGGRIGYESERGVGTTFHFEVPAWNPADALPTPVPQPSATRKPKVLHVEDDEDTLRLWSRLLGSTAVVYRARTLQEAKDLIAEEDFSLVLLDVVLPDGSGLDVLSFLQEVGKGDVPVAVLSAHELDAGVAGEVAAALVKSRSANDELLRVITSLIEEQP